ncbi:hypothetical protein [Paenibacillus ihuae]|uniref:hypothetical protein n=1 Tax=Paenibacillus ihuae TaxID=1232431 RepID=UPI0006D59E11|nr:hypothetical protein [Paenibacillus ihuae]
MEDINTKNLYIKSWFLSPEAIEEKLGGYQLPWKRISRQFFFTVTSDTYDAVMAAIAPVSLENGSVIRESDIDYVSGTTQDLISRLREAYGDENIITSCEQIENVCVSKMANNRGGIK